MIVLPKMTQMSPRQGKLKVLNPLIRWSRRLVRKLHLMMRITIYAILGCPLSYVLWYRPLYRAMRLAAPQVIQSANLGFFLAKSVKPTGSSVRLVEPTTPSLAGLACSSSWFDMNGGHLPLTFRTPPVSPPRPSYLSGMRRVCSLEFRPHLMNSPDTGLADPLLGSGGASGISERSFLPQSTIYNWSCGHFSKPLLTAADDSEEMMARREKNENIDNIAKCQHSSINKLHNQIASWDTKFETGTKTILLQPFNSVVIAADATERIRMS